MSGAVRVERDGDHVLICYEDGRVRLPRHRVHQAATQMGRVFALECAKEGCTRTIGSANKSGYCILHSRHDATLSSRICATDGCGNRLAHNNANSAGVCAECSTGGSFRRANP